MPGIAILLERTLYPSPSYNRAMRIFTTILMSVWATVLLIGCSNPYLDGYTGQAAAPLPDHAPVAVIGANRADPLQMRDFNQAMDQAKAKQQLLGTSSIISASQLRDTVAAEAGRELGASLVVYNFQYMHSTVERDTQTYRRYNRSNHDYYYDRRSFETTRHWYEYRAYFFDDKPVRDNASTDNES